MHHHRRDRAQTRRVRGKLVSSMVNAEAVQSADVAKVASALASYFEGGEKTAKEVAIANKNTASGDDRTEKEYALQMQLLFPDFFKRSFPWRLIRNVMKAII